MRQPARVGHAAPVVCPAPFVICHFPVNPLAQSAFSRTIAAPQKKDGWQSGRMRTPGKRVYRKVTGVRIPPHPLSVFESGVPQNVPKVGAQR